MTDLPLCSDLRRWDAFARRGHFLQSGLWGRFRAEHGWQTLRLLEADWGAQILLRPFGPLTLAYVPRGPILDWEDRGVLERTLEVLEAAARQQRAFLLRLEPPIPPGHPAEAVLRARGYRPGRPVQTRRTLVVPLEADEAAQLARMRPKTRYNCRLARRRGVTVRPARTAGDVEAFYRLLEETAERDRFAIRPLAYYRRLWELGGPEGIVVLLLAEFEGRPVAGLMAAAWGEEAIYLYGASDSRHRRHMPTYLLQLEAMNWARSRGCRRYDLWGIPEDLEAKAAEHADRKNVRDGLWGVYRFKAGFGGEEVRYTGAWDRPLVPLLYAPFRLWDRRRAGPEGG